MDDRPHTAECATIDYRCPGESRPIDRSVHLARLASFYPACRGCRHRHDVDLLSLPQQRAWAEIERRRERAFGFAAEGFEVDSPERLTPELIRQLAASLATQLFADSRRRTPRVLVAADGHWTTADAVAAICHWLQWAGCRASEAGALSSAAVAVAMVQADADAAILVGNASGEPHTMALRFWGRDGVPFSSPGLLDPLAESFARALDRPRRRGGGLERLERSGAYLEELRPLYHGLRPLRLVVDSPCEPLLADLRRLSGQSACQILHPAAESSLTVAAQCAPFPARRLALLADKVLAEQTHFGIWISGDGEACRLVDQAGRAVDAESLLYLLAVSLCHEKPGSTLALERSASPRLEAALASLGVNVVRGEPSRQAMSQAMTAIGAVLGGGPSGRIWFPGPPPAADSLWTVSLLLSLLSQSDRALSEVLVEPA